MNNDGRADMDRIYRRAIADFGITAPQLYDEMDHESLGSEHWNNRYSDVSDFLAGTGKGNIAIYKSVLNLCAQRTDDLAITDRPLHVRAAYASNTQPPGVTSFYVIALCTAVVVATIIWIFQGVKP